jgi:hypothetical protein
MRITYGIILASILLLATHTAVASDCKTWLPLLPATFDGIPRLGQPVVRNNEDISCVAKQGYQSKNFARKAMITIAQGERSEEMDDYHLLIAAELLGKAENVTWETISGYKTVMHIDKESKMCALCFSPRKDVLLILEVDPVVGKEEMLRLGKFLPMIYLFHEVGEER